MHFDFVLRARILGSGRANSKVRALWYVAVLRFSVVRQDSHESHGHAGALLTLVKEHQGHGGHHTSMGHFQAHLTGFVLLVSFSSSIMASSARSRTAYLPCQYYVTFPLAGLGHFVCYVDAPLFACCWASLGTLRWRFQLNPHDRIGSMSVGSPCCERGKGLLIFSSGIQEFGVSS